VEEVHEEERGQDEAEGATTVSSRTTISISTTARLRDRIRRAAGAAGKSVSELVMGVLLEHLPQQDEHEQTADDVVVEQNLRAIQSALRGKSTLDVAIRDEGESTNAFSSALLYDHRKGSRFALLDVRGGNPTAPDFVPATVISTHDNKDEAASQQRVFPYGVVVKIAVAGTGSNMRAALSPADVQRRHREVEARELFTGARKLGLSDLQISPEGRFGARRPPRADAVLDLREADVPVLRAALAGEREWVVGGLDLDTFLTSGKLVIRLVPHVGALADEASARAAVRESGLPDAIPIRVDIHPDVVADLEELFSPSRPGQLDAALPV
jgi:hypothetical protein